MTRTETHIAQLNLGWLAHDVDDLRMADFVAGTDTLNGIAERSPGFVWKYETEPGGIADQVIDGDPMIVVNMTVWTTLADLEFFTWRTLHKAFFKRRGQWFRPMGRAHLVLWRVIAGHLPSLDEGLDRLNHLRRNGPSGHAFDWEWAHCAERAPA